MTSSLFAVHSVPAVAAGTCTGCCGDEDTGIGAGAGAITVAATDAAMPGGACCDGSVSLRLGAEEAEGLAGMFKALGHPVRLQIVELLSRHAGQVCVCDVEALFELSQPTISHHLKILRAAGIVAAEQRGLWVYYFLRPPAVARVRALVNSLQA